MILKICIGSACHVKGSYEVIETFNKIISSEGLEGKIELKACFCMDNCTQGVSVSIEGSEHKMHFSKDTNEEVYRKLLRGGVL